MPPSRPHPAAIKRPRPTSDRFLDERERSRLLREYHAERSPAALEWLVISYRPLARSLAKRYSGPSGIDLDLEQAAYEGLVKALQRFDPDRGVSFTSFAVPTILGEIRRYVRDTAWPAHVPRRVQEQVRAVRRFADTFGATRGRSPTIAELVVALGESEETIVEALSAASSFTTVPLEDRRDGEEALAPADRLGSEDPGFEHVEYLAVIAEALPRLAPEEKLILRLHFADELTQRQIAVKLGYSRSHVSRVLASAVERLRAVTAAAA